MQNNGLFVKFKLSEGNQMRCLKVIKH